MIIAAPGSDWECACSFGGITNAIRRAGSPSRERLADDHSVDASDISVQVANGEVTLTGTVLNRDQKRRAEDCVESVSGVLEVTNNLRINRQNQNQASQDANLFDLTGRNKQDTSSTQQSQSATRQPTHQDTTGRSGRSNSGNSNASA